MIEVVTSHVSNDMKILLKDRLTCMKYNQLIPDTPPEYVTICDDTLIYKDDENKTQVYAGNSTHIKKMIQLGIKILPRLGVEARPNHGELGKILTATGHYYSSGQYTTNNGHQKCSCGSQTYLLQTVNTTTLMCMDCIKAREDVSPLMDKQTVNMLYRLCSPVRHPDSNNSNCITPEDVEMITQHYSNALEERYRNSQIAVKLKDDKSAQDKKEIELNEREKALDARCAILVDEKVNFDAYHKVEKNRLRTYIEHYQSRNASVKEKEKSLREKSHKFNQMQEITTIYENMLELIDVSELDPDVVMKFEKSLYSTCHKSLPTIVVKANPV